MTGPVDDNAPSTGKSATWVEPTHDDPVEISDDSSEASGDTEILLDEIADGFHVAFEDLPSNVQKSLLRFQGEHNYDRFYLDLDAFLNKHLLDSTLRQHPDIKHLVSGLFEELHPFLKSLGTDKGKAPMRSPNYPPVVKGNAIGSTAADDGTKSDNLQGNLKVVRTIGTVLQTEETRPSRLLRPSDMPYLRLTGSQEDILIFDDPPSSDKQPRGQPHSSSTNAEFDFSNEFGSQGRPPSSKESSPDVEAVNRLKKLLENPNAVEKERYIAWRKRRWENEAGEAPGVETSRDQNLQGDKGWTSEAPEIQLPYIIKFLCEEDMNRTENWSRKYAEIAEYVYYLAGNHKNEDWGQYLPRASQLLRGHWIFQEYYYGYRKLNVDFRNQIPRTSKRLPPLSGSSITVEAESPDDMGERKLLLNQIQGVHDAHYNITDTDLRNFLRAYKSDLRELWAHHDERPHPLRGNDLSLDIEDRGFNMARWEYEHYDKCVQSGMRFTADMLTQRPFNGSPQDPASGSQGLSVKSLKSFSQFRGARRAALQQCLNFFDNAENLAACSPWRALVLPLPVVPDKEPGIFFHSMKVKHVPEKAARDPFAYTLAHKDFVKLDSYWADWVRPHAVKDSYGEKLYRHREDPIMPIPQNYKGPLVHDFMDIEMKKVHLRLARARETLQQLKRAQLRAPRNLLTDVLHFVQSGLKGENVKNSSLQFRSNELGESGEPVNLRPEEELWMDFLGDESINQTMLLGFDGPPPDPLFDVFSTRVSTMMDDINPKALFRDTKPVTLDEFVNELNLGVEGPVRRHRFTHEEAVKYASLMEEYGQLRVDQDRSGEPTVARPLSTHHPEDRVQWFTSDDELGSEHEFTTSRLQIQPNDQYDAMSIDTISTDVSIPKSEDFGQYTVGMAKLENICEWDECFTQTFKGTVEKTKTYNMFCCLGYRLGKTIRYLRERHKEDQEKLTPDVKQANWDFLRTIVRYWHDDADKRPNNPDKNPNQKGYDRVTPSYREVVHRAEPEAYQKKWGDLKLDYYPDASYGQSLQVVRKALVREAYENKSLIHPTRTSESQGADGQTSKVRKREPVWAFAHPDRTAKAPRFWDMNRWPVHLQSKETQSKIRESGQKKQPAVTPMAPPVQSSAPRVSTTTYTHQLPPEIAEEIEIPYSDPNVGRRHFKPGATGYWKGDTVLQQQRLENLARQRFESRPKPSPFTGLFSRRQPPMDPTALPEVDARQVPKSKDASPPPISPGEASNSPDGAEEENASMSEDGEIEGGGGSGEASRKTPRKQTHGQSRFASKSKDPRPTLVKPAKATNKTQSAESRLTLRLASPEEE